MRQLSPLSGRQVGLTLIELMVGIAILGIVVLATLPSMGDMVTNSRLQSAAQTLQTTAQWARSEAIKRNVTVQLQAAGGELRVTADPLGAAPERIRTVPLGAAASVADFSLNYSSAGTTLPFGQERLVQIAQGLSGCGTELRCPVVSLTAGGVARICAEGTCQ